MAPFSLSCMSQLQVLFLFSSYTSFLGDVLANGFKISLGEEKSELGAFL